MQVLIVDDSSRSAATLGNLFDGHVVTATHKPAEALALAQTGFAPDLALLDIFMPGMTGWTLARQLRLLPTWRSVFIVGMCAYESKTAPEASRRAGMDMHLTKPLEHSHVSRLLTLTGK